MSRAPANDAFLVGFLDQDAMRKSIDDMLGGRTRFPTKIWCLIMFCRWVEHQKAGVLNNTAPV